MNGGLGRRRPALQPELAQRQGRMGQAKLGELLQLPEQARERASPLKPAQRPQLRPAARLVRTRFAWSAFASRFARDLAAPTTRALREGQHRAGGSGRREELADRLRALGVGGGVVAALLDGQADPFRLRHFREEFRARPALGPRSSRWPGETLPPPSSAPRR